MTIFERNIRQVNKVKVSTVFIEFFNKNGGIYLLDENLYQERAEKLNQNEIFKWMSLTEKDQQTVNKLLNNSTKLLIGPRGAGKSMLMRWAYYKSIQEDTTLPIYVNYEKYLHIEPLLHNISNGNLVFVNWVLAKIIVECRNTLIDCNKYEELKFNELVFNFFDIEIKELQKLVYTLEGGVVIKDKFKQLNNIELSVGSVLDFVQELIYITGRSRAILLLDDAAHAFSSELQKEFFEVFRILKSKDIAAKAAVYPGLTAYSPYFNVGHDALFLEVEYSPEEDGYINFCDELLKKRLGEEKYKRLNNKRDGLLTLYYAANGIPRGLIVMSEYLLEENGEGTINNNKYYEAIEIWVDMVEKFHLSLKTRLPRYNNFIDVGIDLLRGILNEIKEFNKNKCTDKKAVYFGISKPVPNELEKVLDILEYAGLVTEKRDISKGVKGVFKRYMLHLGKIIQYNALAQGKSKTLSYTKDCFERIKVRQFKRLNSNNIFNDDLAKRCTFELPPCGNCGKERISEEARFCAYCGSELKSASLFYEIIEQDISVLPLTNKRVQSIKEGSNINTIKDILMDENGIELKKVRGIKGYWAQKIKSYAEEFIGG